MQLVVSCPRLFCRRPAASSPVPPFSTQWQRRPFTCGVNLARSVPLLSSPCVQGACAASRFGSHSRSALLVCQDPTAGLGRRQTTLWSLPGCCLGKLRGKPSLRGPLWGSALHAWTKQEWRLSFCVCLLFELAAFIAITCLAVSSSTLRSIDCHLGCVVRVCQLQSCLPLWCHYGLVLLSHTDTCKKKCCPCVST